MTPTSIYRVMMTSLVLMALVAGVQIASAAQGTPAPVFAICGIIPSNSGTPLPVQPTMDAHDLADDEIEFDLLFIDLMIPHHESAVVMAQVALERSDRPEIRELAAAIIGDQTAEIAQLQEWRDAWYPGATEQPMSHLTELFNEFESGMMDMGDMQSGEMAGMDLGSALVTMCNAPEPFDLAFIDEMIPHHASAIEMANVGLENTVHPDLKELQLQIIDAQQTEIDQMTNWRTDWFGDATPTS